MVSISLQASTDMYPHSITGTANLVNVTLNTRYKNNKKYQIRHHKLFFQAQNAPKSVFGRGGRTSLRELMMLPQIP